MKSKMIPGLLLAVYLVLTSCEKNTIRASGQVTSREFSFTNYDGLEVGGAFEVFVRFSETEERIEIETNSNLQDRLIVRVDETTLKIRPKDNLQVKGNPTFRAYITTSNLLNFNLSGATTLALEDEWITDIGNIRMSGASNFTGGLMAKELEVQASGASDLDLFGSANSLNARLSGSSTVKNYDLSINDLIIDLSGSSDAFLTVNETIDIKASGASTLNYKGSPKSIIQDLTGTSELNNRN
ncbi:head GIN domain-containing protein [Croceitalea vernalis]|uniref:Head GIN domain-containing protein n=1 Tax=Croceitalea vernalis TaxID=3075599 RepID=A0ABU3BH12_9FLAO|nr:head GIN domain-containing protein [Croceitalea sp. P007]MDT0621454.1 head GIN domain-containing protein [Croceitalea sp. P007]